MPGIRVTHRSPEGHLIEVPGALLDLDRAIKQGAPEYQWNGDERMFIAWNALLERYEVHRACEDGVRRIICPIPMPISGPEVLRTLGNIDSWSRKGEHLVRDMDLYNARVEREHAQAVAELNAAAAEVLKFAMDRSHVPGYHEIKGQYGVGSISRHLPKKRGG